MYLIDTSVWIDYFRQIQNKPVALLENILAQNWPYGITSVIFQEVLQGAASTKGFTKLQTYLATQRFYHATDPVQSYRHAARIYFRCRRKGITIRSTIDCLIAQISIEHGLALIHNDSDFIQMAQAIPELKLV
ncbi:MAG: PIN domain nuclease [Gammaproteobacteria bacterium]